MIGGLRTRKESGGRSKKYLECKERCGNEVLVDEKTKFVTCGTCVQASIGKEVVPVSWVSQKELRARYTAATSQSDKIEIEELYKAIHKKPMVHEVGPDATPPQV